VRDLEVVGSLLASPPLGSLVSCGSPVQWPLKLCLIVRGSRVYIYGPLGVMYDHVVASIAHVNARRVQRDRI
jgi:hypothetical protein